MIKTIICNFIKTLAMLALFISAHPAFSANCQTTLSLKVIFTAEPVIDSSESMKNITNVDRDSFLFFPMGSLSLGMYLPNTKIIASGHADVSLLDNGQYFACVPSATIIYSMTPRILVASELSHVAPCVASEIISHEMGHHRIQRNSVDLPEIKIILQNTLSQFPLSSYGNTPKNSLEALGLSLDAFQQASKFSILEFISMLQARHDNENEYNRIALSCNGELQELLKNSWSGYIYK